MRIFYLICLLSLVLPLSSLNAQSNSYGLQQGDLVFQDLDCGPLCDAIEEVTSGYKGRDFSHVALIVKKDSLWYAVEAIGKVVSLNPLDQFMARVPADKSLKMRPVPQVQVIIPQVVQAALSYCGKAYDDRFIMNNDSLYCSELIFEAFKQAQKGIPLFQLEPMTYKIPGRHSYYPAWEEYYRNMHSSIPEGLPGINPGAISRSPLLIAIP